MAVDDGTLKCLDEAKKGKPRRFVMISKGAKILSLILYKKGSIEKYKKQAKDEAKGSFYFGVVDGGGAELRFNLSSTDGFTDAPVKDQVLKAFLSEEADFTCKPSFVLVSELPAVPFDAEDLSDPLVAKFVQLETRAPLVIQSDPSQSEDIRKRLGAIRRLLEQIDIRAQAETPLNDLERLFEQLLPGSGSSTAPVSSSGSEPPEADSETLALATQLTDSLKKLKPVLDKAVSQAPDQKGELHGLFAQIAAQIKASELDSAKEGVKTLATLVKAILAKEGGKNEANGDATDPISDVEARISRLIPRVHELEKLDAQRGAKLLAVLSLASEKAKTNALEEARNAIQKVEEVLDKSAPVRPDNAPVRPDNTVGFAEELSWELADDFEERWSAAKSTWLEVNDSIGEQLNGLRKHLLESDDSDLRSIAELGLNAITNNHRVAVQKGIMDIDRSEGQARVQFIERLQEVVQDFWEHIETDERVDACEGNPFGVKVEIRSDLGKGFQALLDALDSALV